MIVSPRLSKSVSHFPDRPAREVERDFACPQIGLWVARIVERPPFVGELVAADGEAMLKRELKRGRWGVYTFTPKQADKTPPFGGWQVRCVWHRS